MQYTYTQKIDTPQKATVTSAASVSDASSQGASLQRKADKANNAAQCASLPSRPNNTGMPDNLKAGIESLSGFSMDDVRVHYNSNKPATVQALAYTQGTDIHVAPGQEKCLPHEAWHVAQQMAGRVSPTTNINGMPVNDNAALEREADVMGEKAVQCKILENGGAVQCNISTLQKRNERCGCGNVAQMDVIDTNYDNYKDLYAGEIQRTGTSAALARLENFAGKLKFTDDLKECKVKPLDKTTVGNAIGERTTDIERYVDFVCVPGLNFKMPGSGDSNGVYHNLKQKVKLKDLRRVYAIHELEHLRVINKNISEGKAAVGALGEPQYKSGKISNLVEKKKMKDEIEKTIPQKSSSKNEGVKAKYIQERLKYAVFLYIGADPNSSMECPSVLIELIKLCEVCSELKTKRWKPFREKLVEWYNCFQ